jgi:hypothetical protein
MYFLSLYIYLKNDVEGMHSFCQIRSGCNDYYADLKQLYKGHQ